MHVLIVEDDSILAEGIERVVLQMGHSPLVVGHGSQAHALLLGGDSFDLVLLDIGLPEIDGLTLLRELRSADRRMPVLLLTARDSLDDRIRGLDFGADDYLVKPVALSKLAARIRALLRRSNSKPPTNSCTVLCAWTPRPGAFGFLIKKSRSKHANG